MVSRTWRDNTLVDNSMAYTLEVFLEKIMVAINKKTGLHSEFDSLCSLIETEKAIHQPGHIDDESCTSVPEEFPPWILHMPLCMEGRTLQIWTSDEENKMSPQLLHIPFGRACLLRGDIFHGGCYGHRGNIGFHAQINPRPADGKHLGILNTDRNERLRETDIQADEVNGRTQTVNHVKFTQKYMRNLKKGYGCSSFWMQHPEDNANWTVERMSLKTG